MAAVADAQEEGENVPALSLEKALTLWVLRSVPKRLRLPFSAHLKTPQVVNK